MEILKTPTKGLSKGFPTPSPRGRKNEQLMESTPCSFSSTTLWKNNLLKVKIFLKTSGIKHSTKITGKPMVNIVECGMLKFFTTAFKQGPVENFFTTNADTKESGFQHQIASEFLQKRNYLSRNESINKTETMPRSGVCRHCTSCRGCF